ncbi:MAG TPA: carboxypeptidase-like regulatory domain-containing protein [Kofleriaceae bacterium]|nr:carboxypeptidase-like regulatory domain-containing protein [Kofleriaceae bacterium]
MRVGWIFFIIVLTLGTAVAEPRTQLTGRVTDVLGKPVNNARIYVLSRAGAREEATTNRDGRFRVSVEGSGAYGVVIAKDQVHTYRTVLVQPGMTNVLDVEVEVDVEGGEVVRILDRAPARPAVAPAPLHDVRRSLPYSEESVERDAWAKAWLLLDVDSYGMVQRLKLLKAPGYDLDRICIEEAFKLRFTPAQDASGKPMRTHMLYSMEWPAWGWLVQGNGVAVRRPRDVDEMHSLSKNLRHNDKKFEGFDHHGRPMYSGGTWQRPLAGATSFEHSLSRVPCAGSGPLNLDLRNRAYRDCSQPDLTSSDALPWITRQTIDAAVEDLHKGELLIVKGPPPSRVPNIIMTSVTGTLLVATVFAYYQHDKYQGRIGNNATELLVEADFTSHQRSRARWEKAMIGLSAATLLSGAATMFLWNRGQSSRSFSVQPTPDKGASAAFSMTF